jgi:spoIIIJ-associated protein
MHDVEREDAPPPREAPEKVERARAFCTGLFARLGAAVDVSVRETPEAIGVSLAPREGNGVDLSGALVEAVQYLVNRVVNPRAEGRKWVNLEVGGFPEGGDPAVRAMALRLAAVALRTGKALAVSPMSARDRRAVHLALLEVDGVTTRSEGEGIFRQLLVIPGAKQNTPPARS